MAKSDRSISADDETNVTDIELMPDGRVYVFGTSHQILDVLNEIVGPDSDQFLRRLKQCDAAPVVAPEASDDSIQQETRRG